VSGLSTDATSNPQLDGQTWTQPASQPGGIELDLDLFESHCRDGVAVSRAGPIQDRGRTGDEPLPDFSLVYIGAEHEE
jgi:hypothetical protein